MPWAWPWQLLLVVAVGVCGLCYVHACVVCMHARACLVCMHPCVHSCMLHMSVCLCSGPSVHARTCAHARVLVHTCMRMFTSMTVELRYAGAAPGLQGRAGELLQSAGKGNAQNEHRRFLRIYEGVRDSVRAHVCIRAYTCVSAHSCKQSVSTRVRIFMH